MTVARRAPPSSRNVAIATAVACVLAALVWMPTLGAAEPKRALGLVFACAAAALLVARKNASPAPLPASVAAALAFFTLSALSLAWGLPQGALDLGIFTVGAAIVATMRTLSVSHAIAVARFSGATIGGVTSAWTLIGFAAGQRGSFLHAGQGNPNWLGLLLALTLPLAIDAVIATARARNRRAAFALGLVALVHVPALYLSHSRVAWAAAAIACILQASSFARRSPRAIAVAAAVLAFASIGVVGASIARDRGAETSAHGRITIVKVSSEAARAELPFGAGLGRFAHSFQDAQARELAHVSPGKAARMWTNATTAHDDYVQAAVESGPLAMIALLAALALLFREHLRARFFAGAAVTIAFAIDALGDSPLRAPACVIVIAMILGSSRGTEIRLSFASTRVRAFALAACCAWLTTVAWRAAIATHLRETADPTSLASLSRAARIDPTGESRLALGFAELSRGDARAALADLDRGAALTADVGAFVAMGHAHLLLDDPRAAAREYRRALSFDPGSLRARVGLAEALRRDGDLDGAEAAARIAQSLSPGRENVRELLDRVKEARMDDAVTRAE